MLIGLSCQGDRDWSGIYVRRPESKDTNTNILKHIY